MQTSRGKTAKDFIIQRARELAKEDSSNAGGWEAIEDLANFKLQIDPSPYVTVALLEYLDTIPAPPPKQEVDKQDKE